MFSLYHCYYRSSQQQQHDADYSYVQFLHHDSSQVSCYPYADSPAKGGHDYSYPKLVDCVPGGHQQLSRRATGGSPAAGSPLSSSSPKTAAAATRQQQSMLHNRYFLTSQNVMPDM